MSTPSIHPNLITFRSPCVDLILLLHPLLNLAKHKLIQSGQRRLFRLVVVRFRQSLNCESLKTLVRLVDMGVSVQLRHVSSNTQKPSVSSSTSLFSIISRVVRHPDSGWKL